MIGIGLRGARLPLLYFFDRGFAAVSPSLSDPVDSAGGDPVPDSPGEGGGIGSSHHTSSGGRAPSPWSANRVRTCGLSNSIVHGSPPPSSDSPSISGERGPPCGSSRWSGCRRDEVRTLQPGEERARDSGHEHQQRRKPAARGCRRASASVAGRAARRAWTGAPHRRRSRTSRRQRQAGRTPSQRVRSQRLESSKCRQHHG